MLVDDLLRGSVLFPEVLKPPSKTALILQERIQYMFGILVEPVIVRMPGSYHKTEAFRHSWEMMTLCKKYRIACIEKASDMVKRKAWYVLDNPLFDFPDGHRIQTKVIY